MKLYRLRAFLKTPQGGNKAGVVLDGEHLSEAMMQEIARNVGYSETAFVLPSTVATVKVRFFTPTNEVDLCGHATIATFNLLRDVGLLDVGEYTQETKAGILRLRVQKDLVYMEQKQPVFGDIVNVDDIEKCFKETEFVDSRYPIQIVSTGLNEIFIPVRSVEILHSLTPHFDAITELSNQYNCIGMHLFSLDDEVDAYGRNFAPVVGIDEESATGTSNGALSCYLYRYVQPKEAYILRQGYQMNMPSELYTRLEIEEHQIKAVWVGGTAKIIE